MPYLINHMALKGLKKTIEEAKKKRKAAKIKVYCTQCGAEAKPDDMFCAGCGERLAPDYEDMLMILADDLKEAADIAEMQNPGGKWAPCETPADFCRDIRALRQLFDAEADRRAAAGISAEYYVTELGSVCQIRRDESRGEKVLEWLYYAEGEDTARLPQSPGDSRIPK